MTTISKEGDFALITKDYQDIHSEIHSKAIEMGEGEHLIEFDYNIYHVNVPVRVTHIFDDGDSMVPVYDFWDVIYEKNEDEIITILTDN
jgi:hypothetical protein